MIYQDIVPVLEAANIGTFAEDLWWGDLPSDPETDPDPTIAVYESPGPAGIYTKSGRAAQEGRLQVLTRSYSYETAMQKALDVYELLDDYRSSGAPVYSIRALQRPFDVGAQDEAGRTNISCNYSYYIYPS